MKKIINTLIAAACLFPVSGLAATVTFAPVADAYVQNGSQNADVNYGTAPELRAQSNNSPSNNYDSYLRFDTSAIAEQVHNSVVVGQPVSVKLRVYAALSGSGSVSTSAHAVSDTTWSESAITWNTKPARGSLLGSATVAGTAYAWQEIDVSDYVQNEIFYGRNIISLGLHNGATSSVYASANSREGANPPQLVIVTNDWPTGSITAPADGSVYTAPASVTQSVDAADSDGSIAMVDFIMTENVSGADTYVTVTAPPYTHTWTNVAAGTYTLSAKVWDNLSAITYPASVTITVNAPNAPPSVSLTSPADGSSYTAPASVTLTANATATDSDGSIASVEFHDGATLIASLTAPPYSYTWNDVPAGSHSLTAKATDNQGATTTSAPVTVNVNAAMAGGVYYIYTDHLNTPRVITDASNRTVWRWDSDPFGADKPNEDPDGDGAKFTYNLRFPGQYYDRETNLHYNYFRDYDPTTGRYVQSDPIGLEGGVNLYGYVGGNPISAIDPLGLWEFSDVGNFARGMGSYYRGLYRAGRQVARTSGLLGGCEKSRAEQENAALGFGLRSLSDPDVANEAWNEASNWASQNKSYLSGRLTSGALTTAGGRLNLYGGVSLGLLAGMGDALHGIENGADSHSDIIESMLGRNHPQLSRNNSCGCQ